MEDIVGRDARERVADLRAGAESTAFPLADDGARTTGLERGASAPEEFVEMGRGAVVLGGDVRDGAVVGAPKDANDQVEGLAGLDEDVGERVRNRLMFPSK